MMQWLSYLHIFKRPVVGEAVRARFLLGDRVKVRQYSPGEGGSAPHYVRGKSGVIEEICDASAKSEHMTSDRLKTPARTEHHDEHFHKKGRSLPAASPRHRSLGGRSDGITPSRRVWAIEKIDHSGEAAMSEDLRNSGSDPGISNARFRRRQNSR